MSYLVLARKWRPKRFAELVGQEHVVRALTNALETGRVHHAFLFTGTRGVGKTTIARIFAKSLNCVSGVGADPCGECEICTAVDQGRFVDLLEIDAASNTGVDDVREVIENAQYLPTRGRYKVYLIDEVHMLSKSAFNALLKTLEEPPEHVKFLLATTDPQKLLPTVLSRCLQFHLKRLTVPQIAGQMRHILDAEGVAAEDGGIAQLAHAADGSLRDGLSLLDQALAFGGGKVVESEVRSMLGTVDRSQIAQLLEALIADDGARVMDVAGVVAGFAPDFSAVLDALSFALHRIQLHQLVPGLQSDTDGIDAPALAAKISPEIVQLWYQMAVNGRRDIDYAPNPQVGFEMTLLRMLAFQPNNATPVRQQASRLPVSPTNGSRGVSLDPAPVAMSPLSVHEPATSAPNFPLETPNDRAAVPSFAPPVPPSPAPRALASEPSTSAISSPIVDNESWLSALQKCVVAGPTRELGANLQFLGTETDGRIRVHLPPAIEYLRAPPLVDALTRALSHVAGKEIRLEFCKAGSTLSVETFGDRTRRETEAREDSARESFAADPFVRSLVAEGAVIRAETVRPREH